MKLNIPPTYDGDINEYFKESLKNSKYFNSNKSVIFINGMKNSPKDHMESAIALSELQMCKVIGLYNYSEGALLDLFQCMMDKDTFHGKDYTIPAMKIIRDYILAGKVNDKLIKEYFKRTNNATAELFDLLRKPEHRKTQLFAHSQGNLILSNALTGILLADGKSALIGREVNTFGSPAMNWPPPIKPNECAFSGDPVALLAGIDLTFSISKVGKNNKDNSFFNHGFFEYIKNDPAFVVNRRAVKIGFTLNLDNDGLANDLIKMGNNVKRIEDVVEYLNFNHWDNDDVIHAYVKKLMKLPQKHYILEAIKKSIRLRQMIVRALDDWWTASDEQAGINFIKSL